MYCIVIYIILIIIIFIVITTTTITTTTTTTTTGIESKVAKNEHEFASNLEIVNGLSDGLTSIMKLIALQSQALDCQLIDSGINERNIPEFLCLLEDRIDFIMQMKKVSVVWCDGSVV